MIYIYIYISINYPLSAAIQSSSNDLMAAKKRSDAHITDLEGIHVSACLMNNLFV
jgi:hypothetical protein